MEWLLRARPTTDAIIKFELLLDQVVAELGATVVCAYRTDSFDTSTIAGALCVHRLRSGGDEPTFRFVADGRSRWALSGEVDLSVAGAVEAALAGTATRAPCDVDASGLTFIDVAGMRAIAKAAASAPVVLHTPAPIVTRAWRAAGFDEVAPGVMSA